MPDGNGREKTKGRSIDVMSAIKKSIVVVKATFLCLAHALIAMARVNGDPKYKLYRKGYGLKQPIQELLSASGVDLTNGGGLKKLNSFKIAFPTIELLCMMF